MRVAVLNDIHGNLPALEAVLSEVRQHDVDQRQGAHQLAKRIRERYRENRSEGQRLHFLLLFEIELW